MQLDERDAGNLIDSEIKLFVLASEINLSIPEQITSLSGSGTSRRVQEAQGRVGSVGVSVTGGGWARLRGDVIVTHRRLETSREYNSLRSEFRFSGGARSFFRWMNGNINVGGNRQRVNTTFDELQNERNSRMKVDFNLEVTGRFPGVSVEASAFVRLLQVTSEEGTYWVISDGNPRDDSGGSDRDGELDDRGNDTIIIEL